MIIKRLNIFDKLDKTINNGFYFKHNKYIFKSILTN